MNASTPLSIEEKLRYARHLILPEVGTTGQLKLRDASVLIVGTGGLGSPTALYLAAAGVGRLGLVDFDSVDLSNIHRQIIHGTDDVGSSKMDSATESIRRINPHIHVDQHELALTSENAMSIVADYDVVIDGTDNFATRYLINDACVLLRKRNCYGSIFQFEGQASVFGGENGPCYRCLYPEPPAPGFVPSCAEAGVFGVLPGIVGTIQATEAIKLILGLGETLVGRLLLFDALDMRFREMRVRRNPQCALCGDHPTITELVDYERLCGIKTSDEMNIEPSEVKRWMDAGKAFLLLDVRDSEEYEQSNLGGVLIPLNELKERWREVDANSRIVVHCKSGGRSAQAAELLRDLGFGDVWNLRGGINAWSLEVDDSVPLY